MTIEQARAHIGARVTHHAAGASLAYSHSQADSPWWETVYRKAFPDHVALIDLRHDGWHQRAGRDRAVVLSSGQTIYVDEKVRRKSYDDVAIEIWSVYPKDGSAPYPPVPDAQPGWARKPMGCDWLAYAFEPARTCYLFPFLGVRAALEKHRTLWVANATKGEVGFRWVVADNRRYDTVSIAVPIWILTEAINDAMTITWLDAA
jgi:hypothetical protein